MGAATGSLGPRPDDAAIDELGNGAERFRRLSLAVIPLRQAARWAGLVTVRRMVEVGAFAYAVAHLLAYAADQAFDLGRARPRSCCGPIWRSDSWRGSRCRRRLHRTVYAVGVPSLAHHVIPSKLDAWASTVLAGLFAWGMAGRVRNARRRDGRGLGSVTLAGLAVGTAVATMPAEPLGPWLSFGAPPDLVLAANLDAEGALRPGWIVLVAGLAVALLRLIRQERTSDRPAFRSGA